MITQHMRFTAAAMVPTGDFLAHVGDWTGLAPSQLLGLMRGAAPVSAGASAELERLVSALAQDQQARALLESEGDPAEVLATLRSLDSESGRGGERVSGSGGMAPARRLRHIRALRARAAGRPAAGDAHRGNRPRRGERAVEEQIASVREKVPEERRGEFDELLGEARLMYRLRDERGVFSDIWASGLMRRAVLAAGRRLAERGRIERARAYDRREPRGDARDARGRRRAIGAGAGGAGRLPGDAQRQGGPRGPRRPAGAPAGPVRAAAGAPPG